MRLGPLTLGVVAASVIASLTPAASAADAGATPLPVHLKRSRAERPVDAAAPSAQALRHTPDRGPATSLNDAGTLQDAAVAQGDVGRPDAADVDDAPDAARTDATTADGALDGPTDGADAGGASDTSDAGRPDAGALLAMKPPVEAKTQEEKTDLVLSAAVGLSLVVFLAYLGAHPRVRRLEERLGLTQLLAAGLPFIALGVAAQLAGVFTGPVVESLTPILHFGIGWLGFLVGFRFDVRFLDRVPVGTGLAVALSTSLPFLAVALGCGALMLAFEGGLRDTMFLRDAIALGAAGAMTAPRVGRGRLSVLVREPAEDLPRRIGQLDELAGVAALAILAAYFRPPEEFFRWELTGTAWLFITLGMGVAIGLVLFWALSLRASGSEFLAVVLGSVAFAAGMAGYLRLSPMVVCFVAGALATNLPFRHKARLGVILSRLERPILLVFLTLAGALWDVTDWRGWVLVPVFVVARTVGKGGVVVAMRARADRGVVLDREYRLVIAPVSVLSIAIVLGVESLHHGTTVPWIVTAVIGGSIVFEVLAQLVARGEESDDADTPDSHATGEAPP